MTRKNKIRMKKRDGKKMITEKIVSCGETVILIKYPVMHKPTIDVMRGK